MDDLQKLNTVKDALSRKSSGSARPSIMSGDIIVLHEGRRRARGPYEKVLKIIRAAPDAKSMWSALEEAGLLWPKAGDSEPNLTVGDA